MKSLVIRQLTPNDEAAFLAGVREWEGEDPAWHSFAWQAGMTHADHIRILKNQFRGENMEEGKVPHTMLYGFLGGIVFGRCSVRHRLNERLRLRGGHIGYAVAPRFRGCGYGTRLFHAGLDHLKGLGVTAAMVTCGKSNLAFKRMIERAGGVFDRESFDDEDDELILIYWIDLEKHPGRSQEMPNKSEMATPRKPADQF